MEDLDSPVSGQEHSGKYQINRWGEGFFGIDDRGRVVVRGQESEVECPIHGLIEPLFAEESVSPPLVLRFPDIIRAKTTALYQAFQRAIGQFNYQAGYNCVYPVKVNQNRKVVESILRFGRSYGIGLEAGSKAELVMVIAKSDPSTPILYNGFKDSESIETAIRAARLGRDVTIIIEKPNEIDLVAEISQRLEHRPRLGIRIKLASRGSGHWVHSGGMKSKFGLFVPQLLAAIEKLKTYQILDSFQLLHFHPGSQINDVLRIKASLIEATRIYCDLKQEGIPLNTIDVGGGLAVDYTGNQSTDPSSMNYSLQEYANDVVYYIKRVCDQMETPVPEIISESGRALVAHHSMLVIPVIGSSYREIQNYTDADTFDTRDRSLQPLVELQGTLAEINQENLLESLHDAQQAIEMTLQLFASGMITLRHRAIGESLFWKVCQKIRDLLNTLPFVPVELDSLRDLFAETYVANFSLFQSLRDHWAIGHLFPIVPLTGHQKKPSMDAVLGDITCDSDGTINRFVGKKRSRATLPVHPLPENDPYFLGVFLVGAYQEAIGEQHNLLGQPHSVTIEAFDGDYRVTDIQRGETVAQILESNDPELANAMDHLFGDHPPQHPDDIDFFQQALRAYCYLNPQRQNSFMDCGNDSHFDPHFRDLANSVPVTADAKSNGSNEV